MHSIVKYTKSFEDPVGKIYHFLSSLSAENIRVIFICALSSFGLLSIHSIISNNQINVLNQFHVIPDQPDHSGIIPIRPLYIFFDR